MERPYRKNSTLLNLRSLGTTSDPIFWRRFTSLDRNGILSLCDRDSLIPSLRQSRLAKGPGWACLSATRLWPKSMVATCSAIPRRGRARNLSLKSRFVRKSPSTLMAVATQMSHFFSRLLDIVVSIQMVDSSCFEGSACSV